MTVQQSTIQAPRVLNKLRDPVPPGAHYIGRNSKWGNPFIIGQHGTRDDVIRKYKDWFSTQPHLIAALPELAGKSLVCFCAPKPCHGHYLFELANNERARQALRPGQHRKVPPSSSHEARRITRKNPRPELWQVLGRTHARFAGQDYRGPYAALMAEVQYLRALSTWFEGELKSYIRWECSINEALNSGDGTYRP